MKRLVGVATLFVCLLAAVPADAGGFKCGGCATEGTQMLNNIQLVAKVGEQVKIVKRLYETYVVETQRLQAQILAGLPLSGLPITDVLRVKMELEQHQAALKNLGRDVKSLGTVFDARMTEAQLMNLPFEQYIAREADRISAGNAVAKARVAREVQLMNAVRADIEQVNVWGRKISATHGVHGSEQLFNSQLNMMSMQLTRLVQLTAEQQGSDKAEAQHRKDVQRAGELRVLDEIERGQKSTHDKNDAIIRSLQGR